jgi:hypothetical protein
MHDWDDVASDGFAAIFRTAEEDGPIWFQVREGADGSKDCQMKRVRNDHDAKASNEGCRP